MKSSTHNNKGRFAKGASGNPSGRPPGSLNKTTLACMELLHGQAEKLVQKAMEQALKGDNFSMRLCLERIIPAAKDRCVTLELRPLTTPADLPSQYGRILSAIAEGRITPSEGESISTIITNQMQSMDAVETDRRITELENSLAEVTKLRQEVLNYASGPGRELLKDVAGPRGFSPVL
jgi:hypothetical protein